MISAAKSRASGSSVGKNSTMQRQSFSSCQYGFKSSLRFAFKIARSPSLFTLPTLKREQASCGRHPWLWFDEHLWLACRICQAWLRWHASVFSVIVSRRVERGTQGRECKELCAITPQTEARNKTQ